MSKGDKDAAGWLPKKNVCHFVVASLKTKCTYNLTVDQAEALAMETVLGSPRCDHITEATCGEREKPKVHEDFSRAAGYVL